MHVVFESERVSEQEKSREEEREKREIGLYGIR